MKKIYIVTAGIYSEYLIKAVFENKEKAERYARQFDNWHPNYARVEEWETLDDDIEDDIETEEK